MNAALIPDNDPSVSVHLNTTAAADVALRAFWHLAEAWKLTIAEHLTLLGATRATLYRCRQGQASPLDRHTQEPLSHLFGIYAALQVLLPVPERANEWLRKPNTAPCLAGRSALERMMDGQVGDLFVVRQYLDAERGA